jgi:hypothetical protein
MYAQQHSSKYKICNFTRSFVWVYNLASRSNGRRRIESVREEGTEMGYVFSLQPFIITDIPKFRTYIVPVLSCRFIAGLLGYLFDNCDFSVESLMENVQVASAFHCHSI